MDKEFEKQIAACNIPAWWQHGYTGEDITVFMDDTTAKNHVDSTMRVVETILPKATVLTGSVGMSISGGKVQSATINCRETGELMAFEDFVKKYNIGLINNSKDNGDHNIDSAKAVYLRQMRDKYNLILTGSAGNGYGQPIDNSYYGAGIIVTGVNSKKKSTYAEDEAIDFAAYTAGMAGTSFAAPFMCGMAGLLRCKHPTWTQAQVYDYFCDHCEDLGGKGKDDVYGYGLVFMGDPSEQSQDKVSGQNVIYTNNGNKTINFNPITNTKIKTDGKVLEVDRILYNNENYIRLREFEDVLGVVDVEYDAESNVPVVED